MTQDILSFLANNPSSTANKIAREGLGLSKATSALKRELSEMEGQGSIVRQIGSRGYEEFSVSQIIDSAQTSATVQIPDVPVKSMPGFEVSDLVDGGFRIHAPGDRVYDLTKDQYLLVINGSPEFIVETPDEVLAAIQDFTQTHSMQTFTIKDIARNAEIATKDDLVFPEGRIIQFQIQKHNKAAC